MHARGDSFKTIAAYGGNGAIIHYKPTEVTSAVLGRDSMFLLDSGGQGGALEPSLITYFR